MSVADVFFNSLLPLEIVSLPIIERRKTSCQDRYRNAFARKTIVRYNVRRSSPLVGDAGKCGRKRSVMQESSTMNTVCI